MTDLNPAEEFATLPDLLQELGYDVEEDGGDEVATYAQSYLDNDQDVIVMEADESYVVLAAGGVSMWTLEKIPADGEGVLRLPR